MLCDVIAQRFREGQPEHLPVLNDRVTNVSLAAGKRTNSFHGINSKSVESEDGFAGRMVRSSNRQTYRSTSAPDSTFLGTLRLPSPKSATIASSVLATHLFSRQQLRIRAVPTGVYVVLPVGTRKSRCVAQNSKLAPKLRLFALHDPPAAATSLQDFGSVSPSPRTSLPSCRHGPPSRSRPEQESERPSVASVVSAA